MPTERQLLEDVLTRLERRLANSNGQPETTPRDNRETTQLNNQNDSVQIVLVCAKIREALAILDATEWATQPTRQRTEFSDSAATETFRTKLNVKDGGKLIAERIPSLQPIEIKDDLTRIRGIDEALARRLLGLGVTRYAQIAAWRMDDVRGVASTLDLGRIISQQNWIEQAQLLNGINPVEPTVRPAAVENQLPMHLTTRQTTDLVIKPKLPTVDLIDILALIRAGSATRQTAENLAIAQQHSIAYKIAIPSMPPSADGRPVVAGIVDKQSQAARQISIEPLPTQAKAIAPTVEAEAPRADLPIHEQAAKRLDLLEAEIRTLGDGPDNARTNDDPVSVRRPLATLWHPPGGDKLRSRSEPIPPEAGEAEVEIIQLRPAARDVQPQKPLLRRPLAIRELTVRTATTTQNPRTEEPSKTNARDEDAVEEASVVIIKRPMAKALTTEPPEPSTNAAPTETRRFVRSRSGE